MDSIERISDNIKEAKIERTFDRIIGAYSNYKEGLKLSDSKIFKTFKATLEENITYNMISQRLSRVSTYKTVLNNLLRIPKIVQKSPEWYDARTKLITASDMAQALGKGKFGSSKDIFRKKCGYEVTTFNPDIPPLKWGIKYEDVACSIYSNRNNVKIHDFGLIKHETYKFFGASPDGISELGIMLEIKCPYKRKITGDVPLQYYYQIQGQLDTCNLEECDYLECKFVEYKTEEEFIEDSDNSGIYTKNNEEKGIIIEYKLDSQDKTDVPNYEYSELNNTTDEIIEWKNDKMECLGKEESVQYTRVYYWKIDVYHVKRIYRDIEFFGVAIKELEKFWNRVLEYRGNKKLYDEEILKKPVLKRKEINLDDILSNNTNKDTKCMFIHDPETD